MRSLALLFALFSAAPAMAGDLGWKWEEGQTRTYAIDTEVHLPQYLWFLGEYNMDARVADFRLRLTTDCTASEVRRGGKVATITCEMQDVGIQGAPLPPDRHQLEGVLQEFDEKLTAATVRFNLREDGRMSSFNLKGVNRRNRRISRINEVMRLVMYRAFSAFDLALEEGWTYQAGQTEVLSFPSVRGTLGRVPVHYTNHGTNDEGMVTLTYNGRGVLAPGEMGQSGPLNTYEMTYGGEALFDPNEGALFERGFSFAGMPTPSSLMAEGFEGIAYAQDTWLRLIREGERAPDVGETLELPPTLAPFSSLNNLSLGLAPPYVQ